MNLVINGILNYWFGALSFEGLSGLKQQRMWFKVSDATDKECRVLFGEHVERALSGELSRWAASNEGLLALVLLLDQFPRNIYRGTAKAFAGDARAEVLASQAIAENRHLDLPLIHRLFLYLPLEHSEDLTVQDQSVYLVGELANTTGLEQMKSFHRYALAHRDVIAQFGRFPHRNSILGRKSTEAELEYLQTHRGF